jgi:predicted transcriptional regulator
VSIPKVSVEQIKAARALLRWTQHDLAEASGVSIPTVKRLEADGGTLGGRDSTVAAIRAALESAGVSFLDANGSGPGVRLTR